MAAKERSTLELLGDMNELLGIPRDDLSTEAGSQPIDLLEEDVFDTLLEPGSVDDHMGVKETIENVDFALRALVAKRPAAELLDLPPSHNVGDRKSVAEQKRKAVKRSLTHAHLWGVPDISNPPDYTDESSRTSFRFLGGGPHEGVGVFFVKLDVVDTTHVRKILDPTEGKMVPPERHMFLGFRTDANFDDIALAMPQLTVRRVQKIIGYQRAMRVRSA